MLNLLSTLMLVFFSMGLQAQTSCQPKDCKPANCQPAECQKISAQNCQGKKAATANVDFTLVSLVEEKSISTQCQPVCGEKKTASATQAKQVKLVEGKTAKKRNCQPASCQKVAKAEL